MGSAVGRGRGGTCCRPTQSRPMPWSYLLGCWFTPHKRGGSQQKHSCHVSLAHSPRTLGCYRSRFSSSRKRNSAGVRQVPSRSSAAWARHGCEQRECTHPTRVCLLPT